MIPPLFRPQSLAFLVALAGTSAAQTTWHVDTSNPGPGDGSVGNPYATINEALMSASTVDGDTILVAPGTYSEGFLIIDKIVSIVSTDGPLETHIQDTGVRLGTSFGDNPLLEGFSITSSINVGRMVQTERGTLRRCILHDYRAAGTSTAGAALFVWDEGTLEQTVVVNNNTGITGFGLGFGLFIHNSIGWANDTNGGASWGDATYCAGVTPNIWYGSFIGHIAGDPGLADVSLGDYRLAPGSPCINSGDPSSPLDPDATRTDIGAVPFDDGTPSGSYNFCESLDHSGPGDDGAGIGLDGSRSVAANDFHLFATNCPPNKLGQFYYGGHEIQAPFGNGYRCAGGMGGTQRLFPFVQTDTTGVAFHQVDFTAHPAAAGSFAITPGSTWKFQFWFRDGMVGAGHNLSDGLSVTFTP